MPTPRVTIDELPELTSAVGTDLIVVQTAGVTKKMTLAALQGVTDVVWVGTGEPDDETVELWYDTDAVAATQSLSGETVDTAEMYRIILFSNGDVRAIPVAAVAPAAPEDLDSVIRVNSVKLTWTAVVGATSYNVWRDGVAYATTTATTYRDSAVTLSETYDYKVRAVNTYGLPSLFSDEIEAFIDPALNVTPVVELRSWPTSIALGNRAIIRINAADADAQTLAYLLSTDVGSLVATADPTVWILDPV